MSPLEDLIRETLRSEAARLREVRPLRLTPEAAADVMTVRDNPVPFVEPKLRRAAGWLLPATTAASVVAIVLAAVFAGHLYSQPAATRGGTGTARPEFYVTADHAHKLVLDVRRTSDGAVTASTSLPGNWPQGGYLTAEASDRAFFIATFPCTTADIVSRFYRITITDSGQISRVAPLGRGVPGMVIHLAVSPDGSQIAYDLEPGACEDPKTIPVQQGTVRIMNLSTGAVRTWHDTATPSIPAQVATSKPGWDQDRAGWISGGKLHPLPGTTYVYSNAIAW